MHEYKLKFLKFLIRVLVLTLRRIILKDREPYFVAKFNNKLRRIPVDKKLWF